MLACCFPLTTLYVACTFPPPILPVMGAALTLRQQSCMVAEQLANVAPCADCIRPRQLLKLGLECEMAHSGEGIILPISHEWRPFYRCAYPTPLFLPLLFARKSRLSLCSGRCPPPTAVWLRLTQKTAAGGDHLCLVSGYRILVLDFTVKKISSNTQSTPIPASIGQYLVCQY